MSGSPRGQQRLHAGGLTSTQGRQGQWLSSHHYQHGLCGVYGTQGSWAFGEPSTPPDWKFRGGDDIHRVRALPQTWHRLRDEEGDKHRSAGSTRTRFPAGTCLRGPPHTASRLSGTPGPVCLVGTWQVSIKKSTFLSNGTAGELQVLQITLQNTTC